MSQTKKIRGRTRSNTTALDDTTNKNLSHLQIAALSAATGKAFTTFLAGFALTTITLPNTSRLPALVAGFMRVLILQRPATVKMPLLLTCLVPRSANAFNTPAACDFLSSHFFASSSAIAPCAIALAPAFIAFIGAIACYASQTLSPQICCCDRGLSQ